MGFHYLWGTGSRVRPSVFTDLPAPRPLIVPSSRFSTGLPCLDAETKHHRLLDQQVARSRKRFRDRPELGSVQPAPGEVSQAGRQNGEPVLFFVFDFDVSGHLDFAGGADIRVVLSLPIRTEAVLYGFFL